MTTHPTHDTRFSDSSLYDEKCVNCGATDARNDKRLEQQCPAFVDPAPVPSFPENATFITFKPSGKYYTSGRGYLSEKAWKETHETIQRRMQVLIDNSGKFPGLSGDGSQFIWVIIPDENADGFPLLLKPSFMVPPFFGAFESLSLTQLAQEIEYWDQLIKNAPYWGASIGTAHEFRKAATDALISKLR